MFKFLALVALAALASGATLSRDVPRGFPWSPSGRIIGGHDAKIEDVPYQISLRHGGSHSCGGSIISEYWIVTAGHCAGSRPESYTIVAGSTHRLRGGSKHSVASIIVHEHFDTTYQGIPFNDVALMRVKEPFNLDATRQPIELIDAGKEVTEGSEAIITGWGSTGGWGLPDILQLVEIPIVSKKNCNKAYKNVGGLPAGQICAAYPEGGKDACQGDSGGPLVVDGRLTGLTSWGSGCAIAGQPGVYTEVAAFREWIRTNSGV